MARAIVFDKSPTNTWFVTWHQDKTVAVSSKFDFEGWGTWSFNDGVNYVQPSLSVLEQRVTFRIHLDESTIDNGCLKVILNSQNLGRISQSEIYRHIESTPAQIIEAPVLSTLAMGYAFCMRRASHSHQRDKEFFTWNSVYKLPHGIAWA